MTTDFEEFKNREFLGDKLLNLVLSDVLLSRGMSRNEVNRELPKRTNTLALCAMYKKLGITEHASDKTQSPSKRKANAVEEYLFSEFTKNGYEHVKKLITE